MYFQKIIENYDGSDWLKKVILELQKNFYLENILHCFSKIPRHFGNKIISITKDQSIELQKKFSLSINFKDFSIDQIARIELLLTLKALPEKEYKQVITECYKNGDNSEKITILKALFLLPYREFFIFTAQDACRTNVTPVFAAIAINNPFPAEFFDELYFNNLVLKAIFLDLPILNILGLEKRKNSKLADMVGDWMDEREAADRVIMPQVWTIVSEFAQGERLERVYRYLTGELPDHRYWLAFSLGNTKKTEHLPMLEKQFQKEKINKVRDILGRAIENIQANS